MNVNNQEKAEELMADGLVGIKAAASFLQISVAGLYSLMGRGELVFVKIGKSRRIPRRALVELATRNLVGGGERCRVSVDGCTLPEEIDS